MGRARPAPPAASLLRRQPLLAAQGLPRLRRRPDRLRADGHHRQRAARCDGPLRPALHLRLRARLLRGLSAGARGRLQPCRSGDRGCGVRLRALQARTGRPSAGDLERRDPAGDRVRGARDPAEAAVVAVLGLAGGGLAGLDRLGARPAVRLRARRCCRDRGGGLAGPGQAAAPAADDRRRGGGRRRLHRDLLLDRAPLPLHRGQLPGGEAEPPRGRRLLRARSRSFSRHRRRTSSGARPRPASATTSPPGRRRRSSRAR